MPSESGAKLLLIDDEGPQNRDDPVRPYMWYYATALEAAGFVIETVTGTLEAREAVARMRGALDLVILDVMMPHGHLNATLTNGGMTTGLTLAEELRELCPNLRIVVLTNYESGELERRAKRVQGVEAVLFKSQYTPNQLVVFLRNLLKIDC